MTTAIPLQRLDPATVELSHEEIRRYSRHLIMPEVALSGQKKLKAASVLLIGTGGLGSPLALYLAAAGIGRIGLVDYDVVDPTNLHRQIIHGTASVGKLKVESAKARMLDVNPDIEVVTYNEPFTSANAMQIAKDYDIIVDGTDNFPTRYLTNDVCVLLGKPNVYGSIFRFEGQASVFYAKEGPCYRCLFPEPPPPGLVPSCAEGGVLGILPGTIGTIQATETIKLILGIGQPLIGRLLLYDALSMTVEEVKLHKNPKCAICGPNPTVTELIDYEQFCGVPGHDRESETGSSWDITPTELAERLRAGNHIKIIDVREPYEWEISHIEGAQLIPLGTLAAHMHELDSADEIVLQCRTGARSLKALELLYTAGFRKLKNLKGGINAWAREVDPSLPIY
ncbi:MAG: molybdopterin-synthase adenylyltransferase MoeB [Anaerolineales bacterium]|nr:molybdopterin-synthase adenylyltransferase MoeB [Anaerolineales bacterium]